jgi:hypothetical protein
MFLRRLQQLTPVVINVALALLVLGLGIVFAVYWGPNIKFTHTYYNLSRAVSAYHKPVEFLYLYMLMAGLSIMLVLAAISGRRFFLKWEGSSSVLSAVAAAVVILFGLFVFVEIESPGQGVSSLWLDPRDNLVISSSSPNQSAATYYIYFDKSGPRRLRVGQTDLIEITFTMLDHEVPGAYPIALDPSHTYAVTVPTTAFAFNVANVEISQMSPTPIVINSPTRWSFLISPRAGYEGRQTVTFKALILDQTNGSQPVHNFPYASIELDVVAPFGLPNWLVSAQTGAGAIVGSVLAIVVTWSFGQLSVVISKRRQAKDKQTEEAAKIWRPR